MNAPSLQPAYTKVSDDDGWISTGDGVRVPNDLYAVMVRNRYGEEYGPVLAGMLDTAALDGEAFHASCDIAAYRVVQS